MKEFFAVAVCLPWVLLSVACPAVAQETPTTPKTKPASERTRTVKDAARLMEAEAKIVILAESSVAESPVTLWPVSASNLTLEQRLTYVVAQLPHGTRWMKLMLPPPPEKSRFRPDDVADLVVTQEKMFGLKGDAIAVVVQTIAQQAAAAESDLAPVYLIINSRAHAAMAFRGGEYAQMTEKRREEWLNDAAQAFRSLDGATRLHTFQSMFTFPTSLLGKVLKGMSEEEGKTFIKEMGDVEREDGTVHLDAGSADK